MPDTSGQEAASRDVPYRTRSGNWVYLPEDAARHHPLYGVYAWALLLLAFLVLGPIILVYQDVRILVSESQRPDEFWIVLIAEVIFLAAAWKAAGRLGRESPDFRSYFYVAALIGLCVSALYFATLVESGPRELDQLALSGLVWRAVPILVWTLYVLRSRRINVTIRKRVPADDPFLRAQWLSDNRSEEARPARVIRHVPGSQRSLHREQPPPRGAVRQPVRRPRRRPVATDGEQHEDEETVVVHRAAEPRRPAVSDDEIVETYSPRRPVRSLAGALEPYQSARQPLMRREEAEGYESRLPEAAGAVGAPDATHLQRLQNSEILDRLRQLQLAREEGLVTAAEERAKRQELLKQL